MQSIQLPRSWAVHGSLVHTREMHAGEDTDAHQNDAVWYHDFASGSTTRILSTPYGSETTGVFWYPNINGWGYMMANVQHPYGESDEDRVYAPLMLYLHLLLFGFPDPLAFGRVRSLC